MEPSKHVTVQIDLSRVRQNAEEIVRSTGVALIAVVKADAYGLGAGQVAGAIGDLVEGFYVFDAEEAVVANLFKLTGKRTIALHGDSADSADYVSAGIQPVVWSIERATMLRAAKPVLSVDTGQQRFAATAEQTIAVATAGDCREIMTHATQIEHVTRFAQIVASLPEHREPRFLHAAGTALLDQPSARLNAVRPGLGLYRGAMRVSARLMEARDSTGPAGYTQFSSARFGVILAGYRNGIKPGPCYVNGQPRRMIEVGMQSAFIELGMNDRVGDEVTLLGGNNPSLGDVASAWGCSQQEVLVRFGGSGVREWIGGI